MALRHVLGATLALALAFALAPAASAQGLPGSTLPAPLEEPLAPVVAIADAHVAAAREAVVEAAPASAPAWDAVDDAGARLAEAFTPAPQEETTSDEPGTAPPPSDESDERDARPHRYRGDGVLSTLAPALSSLGSAPGRVLDLADDIIPLVPALPEPPLVAPETPPGPEEPIAPASAPQTPSAPAALGTAALAAAVLLAAAPPTFTLTLGERLRRFAFLAALYARIAKERLLDHEGREKLLAQVRLTPGAPLADLARSSNVPRNTAVYHLRRMEKEGLVSSVRNGRVRLYFAPGSLVRALDANALAALRHPVSRAAATAIGDAPGVDQRGLCERLGVQPSLAHWHASRLVDAGVVTRERAGRHVRYYPGTSFHLVRG